MNAAALRADIHRACPQVVAVSIHPPANIWAATALYVFINARATKRDVAEISRRIQDVMPLGECAVLVCNHAFG